MKIFTFLSLFTFSLHAQVIRYVNTGPGFIPEATISVSEKSVTLKRNINFLEQDNLTLGSYSLKDRESSKDVIKKFQHVDRLVNETEKVLKASGQSHHKLAPKQLHGPRYEVGSIRVYPGSREYDDLDAAFKGMLREEWILQDGVKVDLKAHELSTLKGGSVVRKIPFFKEGACDSEKPFAQCEIKGQGVLSLQ